MAMPPSLETLVWIAGGIGAAGAIWVGIAKAAKTIAAAIRWIVDFSETLQQVAIALPTLLGIAAEFKNNGGNSLRDVIDDLRERLKRVELKTDETKLAAVKTKEVTEGVKTVNEQQNRILNEIKESVRTDASH